MGHTKLVGLVALLAIAPCAFSAFPALVDLADVGLGQGLTVKPASRGAVADLNNDGFDDLIVSGQPDADGAFCYVFFGPLTSDAALPGTLDGTNGFAIRGIGGKPSRAGDVNADGVDDIIIGKNNVSPGPLFTGAAWVVFGRDTAVVGDFPAFIEIDSLDGANGFALTGTRSYLAEAASVGAGDLNNDGVDDVIIGSRNADPVGGIDTGAAYVVFGRDTAAVGDFPATIDLTALGAPVGLTILGIDDNDHCGEAVAHAGDLNHDGVSDVAIGAPGAAETYVLFGAPDLECAGAVALSSLDGTNGFVIEGIDAPIGSVVAGSGDVNHDGISDILIDGLQGSFYGTSDTYIVFGRDTAAVGGFPALLQLSSLNGANGFIFGHYAETVAAAGDPNGDGIDDILIGAPSGYGDVYVVYGRDTAIDGNFDILTSLSVFDGAGGFVLRGTHPSDRAGNSVSPGGDLNADGVDDILLTALGPSGSFAGNWVRVVFGRPPIPFPPDPVSLLWPPDLATGFATETIFQWGASPGADSYLLEVDDDPAFASPEFSLMQAELIAQAAPASLAPSTLYHWRVTASNAGGDSPTAPFTFTTAPTPPAPPGAFVLYSPGASGVPLTATIDWDPSADASRYLFEVRDQDGVILTANVDAPATSIDLPEGLLGECRVYTVSVVALGPGGTTIPTPYATVFKSDGPHTMPGAFDLSSPAYDPIDETVHFAWPSLEGAGRYRVEYGTASNLSNATHVFVEAPTHSLEVQLPPSTNYSWRVQAYGCAGNRITSIDRFKTDPAVSGPFTLVAPAAGASDVNTGPSLAWSASAEADDYLVEIGPTNTLGAPIVSATVTAPATSLDLPVATLATDTVYFWRVTARRGAGYRISAPVLNAFTTTATPPPACAGDVDADGDTDIFDFGSLLIAFGTSLGDPGYNPDADLNGDDTVNVLDFALFAPDFGCGAG